MFLRYEKLPKKTPRWVVTGILVTGGCLGYSIIITSFVALYGLFGVFGNLFFPGSIQATSGEAAYLGLLALVAGITATLLSALAMKMNELSKKALPLSRIVWIPLTLTAILVLAHDLFTTFHNYLGSKWIVAVAIAALIGSVIPLLLLRTKASRAVHKR